MFKDLKEDLKDRMRCANCRGTRFHIHHDLIDCAECGEGITYAQIRMIKELVSKVKLDGKL